MHRYALALTTAAALVGCGPDYEQRQVESDLIHTQQPVDFGQLAVAQTETTVIKLDVSRRAPLEVLELTLTGEGAASFDVLTPTPFEVPYEGGTQVEVAYHPLGPGWHSATLGIVYRGSETRSESTIHVRGHAVEPELILLPWQVDFGPVPAGSVGTRALVARNTGDLDVILDGSDLANPDFGVASALPLEIPAGLEKVIQLTYDARTDAPAEGSLTLLVGELQLGPVPLKANDCTGGDPAAWDQDGDGFTACALPLGDCDDGNIDANPAAREVWDGVDNDCDGVADEGTRGVDDDGDGFCEGPGACTDGSMPGDCGDADPGVSPTQAEIDGNGIDDDCDGIVDSGTVDADGDGVGPAGGDCDDSNAAVRPGAPEIGDWLDNDCDGTIDEGTPLRDDDFDGYCDDSAVCSDGSLPGDCNDLDRFSSPGAVEAEDWRDNDCDGQVDEGTNHDDTDLDGFSELGGDCDDTDPSENPATSGVVCVP